LSKKLICTQYINQRCLIKGEARSSIQHIPTDIISIHEKYTEKYINNFFKKEGIVNHQRKSVLKIDYYYQKHKKAEALSDAFNFRCSG